MARVVGELSSSFNTKDIIERGGFSTVFRGFHSSRPVAIKRMQMTDLNESVIQREVELMQKASYHPNILEFIHEERTEDFLYIATELCRGTLGGYVKGKYNDAPRFESNEEILSQITKGLAHLHSLDIVHRDIKPNNILVFIPNGTGTKPVIKLADFGISKMFKADKKDVTNTNVTNPAGTCGWSAPEVYKEERIDLKVDIWSLGCIFAYTLCGGKHPFGEDVITRLDLIRKENIMPMVQTDMIGHHKWDPQAFSVIKLMLRPDPSKRPTVEEVLKHPFFIHKKERMKYFEKLWSSLKDSVTSHQRVQLEEMLLGSGIISIDQDIKFDHTPLHILCNYYKNENLIDLVILLIKKGADVNAEIHNGDTPLHLLCWNYEKDNLISIVKLLIEKGAHVNAKNECGTTPLLLLCEKFSNDNLVDVVQLFIEKGADINVRNKDGRTPLHLLLKNDKNNKHKLVDIVYLLIKRGADIMAKDRSGYTALHFLCGNKKNDNMMALIKLLIEADADVNARDNFKATPLHFLCSYYQNGDLEEVLRFLINECEANVKAKTKNGSTPLHQLCYYHKKDDMMNIIKVLIHEGAQVNAKDTNGATPLHIVCNMYNNYNLIDIVQLLIQNGAEVNTKNKDGLTPLHSLFSNYDKDNLKDIVQLLIRKGASANAMNKKGETPFLLLCRFYKIDNGSKEEDDLKSFIRLAEENEASMNGTTPNNYLVHRKENTMLAMESTSPAPSEAVGVPKDPIITKDEDASSVQQSITTTERPTTAKALPQEPLQGPSSDAHDGEFIEPGTSRKRKKNNYPFANVRQNSEQFFNNAEPITAQLEPAVLPFMDPGTASIIKPQLNQEPIAIQPLDTQYNGPSNKVRRMEDPAYSQPVIDDSQPPPTGAS